VHELALADAEASRVIGSVGVGGACSVDDVGGVVGVANVVFGAAAIVDVVVTISFAVVVTVTVAFAVVVAVAGGGSVASSLGRYHWNHKL